MNAVRTATVEERGELVDTLTAAFATDPVVTWLLGGPGRTNERRLRRFFRLTVPRSAAGLGGCDLADDGAAVWYAPGAYASASGSLGELARAVATFGRGLGQAGEADAEMRRLHPTEPHWYLQFVGVRPGHVGRGTGTALLEHRLATIDAAGGPAYLESSLERNLPLYERLGFVVREEVRLGPGAPPEWLMWRAAR